MAGGELHILLFLISSIILTCSPHIFFSSFSTRGNSFTPFLLLMGMFQSINRVQLFVIPWTIAHQTPLSMGFSRQECWSGLPYPPSGDLLYSGIEPRSPALQANFLLSEPPGKPNKIFSRRLFNNAINPPMHILLVH